MIDNGLNVNQGCKGEAQAVEPILVVVASSKLGGNKVNGFVFRVLKSI